MMEASWPQPAGRKHCWALDTVWFVCFSRGATVFFAVFIRDVPSLPIPVHMPWHTPQLCPVLRRAQLKVDDSDLAAHDFIGATEFKLGNLIGASVQFLHHSSFPNHIDRTGIGRTKNRPQIKKSRLGPPLLFFFFCPCCAQCGYRNAFFHDICYPCTSSGGV